MYRPKNCGLATRKCANADSPKNMATLKPTDVLKRVTGAENVDPGGPEIYVAVIGSENPLLKAKTAIICTRCKVPARTYTVRRRAAVIAVAIASGCLELEDFSLQN